VKVAEIWRYPVKSMAGERLEAADVSSNGIAGDRIVQVVRGNGRVATARTCPKLLGHHATLTDHVRVDGRIWTDPNVLADVRAVVDPAARLELDQDPEVRFDILPLLVATDGAIAAFGRDRRRLRPNIVIGGVEGLDERQWPGSQLRIGDLLIDVDSLRERCVMTTFDPDTIEQDPDVLKDIVRRFDGQLALNCAVSHPGTIHVGQEVELIRPRTHIPVSHDARRRI
jgi:MOSC domain-containing protein